MTTTNNLDAFVAMQAIERILSAQSGVTVRVIQNNEQVGGRDTVNAYIRDPRTGVVLCCMAFPADSDPVDCEQAVQAAQIALFARILKRYAQVQS